MATTLTWPSSLPNPVYPLEAIREDSVIRTPFEAGYEQTRNKYTRRRPGWRLKFSRLKQADYDNLRTFYETTTDGGTLSFMWTHPQTGETAEYRFMGPIKDALVDVNIWAVEVEIRKV